MGNPKAKMLVHLLAEACVKAGVRVVEGSDEREGISKYGQTYLDGRKEYADRAHATECNRCGPAGRPAAAGSPWSKAHQHNAALRLVGKALLRDLWLAARADATAGEVGP